MLFYAGIYQLKSSFIFEACFYCALYKIDLKLYIDGLVQERRNSIANALELRLSCTNP